MSRASINRAMDNGDGDGDGDGDDVGEGDGVMVRVGQQTNVR